MKNILITGARGFIGRALCDRLSTESKVIGVDIAGLPDGALNIAWEQADISDLNSVTAICEKYSPDVVIHCAGIAHQKIGAVDALTYMRVNSEATENLAKTAARCNPNVCFIFLSSVSVYGESPQITQINTDGIHRLRRFSQKEKNSNNGVSGRDSDCRPSSDYALSKLHAERRLTALSDRGTICNLVILRLAPVYDRDWTFNLDRRVLAPMKAAYIRFGSGSQRMSALARPNLVDFIEFLMRRLHGFPQITDNSTQQNDLSHLGVVDVCDADSYEFNTIIQVFKKSCIRPNRPVIPIPLSAVWFATRIAGIFFSNKRDWIHSCYDKLAADLVFDNSKMIETGFRPRHSLETMFLP